MTTELLYSGEPPLVVFVSGVISDEMKVPRQQAALAIGNAPYLTPWLFEFTPAAAADPVEVYLEKARTADLFVWLVGSETTEPVQLEVREAMRTRRRILVVRLPADSRDERTRSLLEEVGSGAKWVDVPAVDLLPDYLMASIYDEVVRAIRGRAGGDRMEVLEKLGRSSRARCIARWQAAGLPWHQAVELADDPLVGAATGTSPQPGPLTVLVGDLGIGKSLLAERLFQGAVARAREDNSAPFPVYLRAADLGDDLRGSVARAASGMGDPELQGCFLVIDATEALGANRCRDLITQARIMANASSETRVVITSRSLPEGAVAEEATALRSLSEADALHLVGLARGKTVEAREERSWPDPIGETIRRPLFALLLGALLKTQSTVPEHEAQIVTDLVRRSLDGISSDTERIEEALRRLAVLSMGRQEGAVPLTDLGLDRIEIEELDRTGLIARDSGLIRFVLSVHLHWFAAQSVLAGVPDVEALAHDQTATAQWAAALAVALTIGTPKQCADLLGPLVRNQPGEAVAIIASGVPEWGRGGGASPAPPADAAHQVRSAMEAWISGIGPLGGLVLAPSPSGQLPPLAARVDGDRLATAWFVGHGEPPAEDEIPSAAFSGRAGFDLALSNSVGSSPAWAWRWALKTIQFGLERLLATRGIPPAGAPMLASENAWLAALTLARHGSHDPRPIPLEELDAALEQYPGTSRLAWGNLALDLDALRTEIKSARADNLNELQSPWPGPDLDLKGGWVWSAYSVERMVERTAAVYDCALRAYESIVNSFLIALRSVMATGLVLPARFVGVVEPPTESGSFGPVLHSYLEPLPAGSDSEVEIRSGMRADVFGDDPGLALRAKLRSLRRTPGHVLPTSRLSSSVLDIFGPAPATPIAYEMLWSDLEHAGWLADHFTPEPTVSYPTAILGGMSVFRVD